MKITKISPAVKTAGRYNIFLDEKYAFSLDETQLVGLKLNIGQEIGAAELAQLESESDFGKNYLRALDLVSRRMRSEREIRDYAFRKRWTPENTERVVARLYQYRYLDDAKFAQRFVASRAQRDVSLKKLKVDLAKKGIKNELIAETLAADESFDEFASLKNVIAKKAKRYDDERKLVEFLLRRGFRYDDIRRALAEQLVA